MITEFLKKPISCFKQVSLFYKMMLKIKKIELSEDFKNLGGIWEGENTGVIVETENGERYYAAFFSFDDIEIQRMKNRESGEFLNGKYFWRKGMLLIDECSKKNIRLVIDHIIDEGDFLEIFIPISQNKLA